jgi:hypothetical protein
MRQILNGWVEAAHFADSRVVSGGFRNTRLKYTVNANLVTVSQRRDPV